MRKGVGGEDGYSGFGVRDPTTGREHLTELADVLLEHEIERVVIVGLARDYCVKETALDAVRARFATTVLSDGVRAVERQPGDEIRALDDLSQGGVRVAVS